MITIEELKEYAKMARERSAAAESLMNHHAAEIFARAHRDTQATIAVCQRLDRIIELLERLND